MFKILLSVLFNQPLFEITPHSTRLWENWSMFLHSRYQTCCPTNSNKALKSCLQLHSINYKHWTVHTSTKARVTSAAMGQITTSSRLMSVHHFPYLPIVTNPENNPLYPDGDSDHHRNFTICSSAHCPPSLKISCKSVWKFLHKVANRQTNNDKKHILLGGVNIPTGGAPWRCKC